MVNNLNHIKSVDSDSTKYKAIRSCLNSLFDRFLILNLTKNYTDCHIYTNKLTTLHSYTLNRPQLKS